MSYRTKAGASLERMSAIASATFTLVVDRLPLLRTQTVRGILIDGPKSVSKHARRSGPLNEDEISVLHNRLNAALPAA